MKMRNAMIFFFTLCLLAFFTSAAPIREEMAYDAIIVYPVGRNYTLPGAVYFYHDVEGLVAAEKSLGDPLTEMVPRERISYGVLAETCDLILEQGSVNKQAEQSLLVVLIGNDGSELKRYIDVAASRCALSRLLDPSDDEQPLEIMLKSLEGTE